MSQSQPAIVVDGLTKSYGERRAVDGLSFSVEAGEVFSLLGPNGAGKSTTVEILEGYRRADSGKVSVLGIDPSRNGSELRPRIGVMLQEGGLYPAITPREALVLFAAYYEHPRDPDDLLRTVGLQEAAATRYRRLSGGQKQRLALALALLPRPHLVFLDEPTAGLDPQARRVTWEIVRELHDSGVTVLLTTHYLEEAERLADRVAIIDEGRLVALDTPARLLQSGSPAVRLRTSDPIDPSVLRQLPSALGVRREGDAYIVEPSSIPDLLVEITTAMRDLAIAVTELRVGGGSLEDVFLRLTGKEFPE